MELSVDEERVALAIARKTLEIRLADMRHPEEVELPLPQGGIFSLERAVFVTLRHDGALRGCIGHIEPVEPLWRSICSNAIAAATRDHRFNPVDFEELSSITIEISLLTPPISISSPEEFVIGRDGIILEVGSRGAVFLPQVATEQGWDTTTTLTHLALKAGLHPDGYLSPDAKFRTFQAQVFSE